MKICSMIHCNIKIERFYLGFIPYLFPTKLELNKGRIGRAVHRETRLELGR